MHPAAARLARTLAVKAVRDTSPYRVYRRANFLYTRVPGAGLLRTGPKTAQWATKAAVRSRAQQRRPGDEAPQARPTLALGAQVAMDEAILGVMMRPSKFPSTDDYERVGAEVAAAAEMYRAHGWVDDAAAYHREPSSLEVGRARRDRWMRERFEHLSWQSDFVPREGEPGRDRWLGYRENRTAHAHLMRHADGDRPWLVCLHGFGMGFAAANFSAFVARKAHLEMGLNLAFPIMPLHGPRKAASAPDLLSYDLMNTVHGITQAVWDIRRLIGWLRTQTDRPIGVHGISLGGYTGALLAGLEPVDMVLAGIPAVDFPGLFRHHSPDRVERAARHNGLLGDDATDAHRPISPLAVEPLVPKERRFVYAGLGDRMVPPPQPRALWEHWDRPEMCWYPGNHVGFMWSPKVKRFVTSTLDGVLLQPA